MINRMKYQSVFAPIFLIVLLLLITATHSSEIAWAQTSTLMASARDLFDLKTGDMSSGPIGRIPDAPSLLQLNDGRNCPGEIAIYVHGVWADKKQAEEQTDRVNLSLIDSDYNNKNNILLIGFSWDSNTDFSLTDKEKAYKAGT